MKTLQPVQNSPALWNIPPLRPEDHKYTRGHVLILGGEEMTGAARLAALAAQRCGSGLVTIAATPKTWPVYATLMLSVIVGKATANQWQMLLADDRIHAVLIGPGAGVNARTRNALRAAARANKPLILDADALTLLATDSKLRADLQHTAKILTPHEGEYTRLATALKLDVTANKPTRATALAKALNAVIVFKGSDTIITDGIHSCVTHPPAWLATGGTGDVLAGMIAALVGQGMGLYEAASAAVWLHASAANTLGRGMIAEDIIAAIPGILRTLQ
ncbi:MAG: NAD(P)H-hydrate dehydratase [Rickettsiales bacterium]